MILWNLRPQFARHMIGNSYPDFRALVQAGIDVEEGFSRRLWSEPTLNNHKGKRLQVVLLGNPRLMLLTFSSGGPLAQVTHT